MTQYSAQEFASMPDFLDLGLSSSDEGTDPCNFLDDDDDDDVIADDAAAGLDDDVVADDADIASPNFLSDSDDGSLLVKEYAGWGS